LRAQFTSVQALDPRLHSSKTARLFRRRWLPPNFSAMKRVPSQEHFSGVSDALNRLTVEQFSSMKSVNSRLRHRLRCYEFSRSGNSKRAVEVKQFKWTYEYWRLQMRTWVQPWLKAPSARICFTASMFSRFEIPALRERVDDISLLVEYLIVVIPAAGKSFEP